MSQVIIKQSLNCVMFRPLGLLQVCKIITEFRLDTVCVPEEAQVGEMLQNLMFVLITVCGMRYLPKDMS